MTDARVVLEFLATWAWPVVRAILLLGGAWWAAGRLQPVAGRLLDGRIDLTLRSFLLTALRPVALALAIPPALDSMGVSMSSALAVLSTAGLAIALAIRDSLSNVASGAILLTVRPFRVGDQVTIAGVTGAVRRIGFLLTEVECEDGRRVSLTNDKVLSLPMEWHGADGRVRVEGFIRLPLGTVDDSVLARIAAAAGQGAVVAVVDLEAAMARIVVRRVVDATGAAAERADLLRRVLPIVREAGAAYSEVPAVPDP